MKELKTEVQISASPEKVWRTLSDLTNWSSWNPIINNIEGKFEVNAELLITMANSNGGAGKRYKAIVTEINTNKRFIFTATMLTKVLFSAEKILELTTHPEDTILIQREIYTGIMVPLFWKKLKEGAQPMLISMNEALKEQVEK